MEKISKESAEEHFKIFLDYYEIDLDEEDDDEVRSANKSIKKKIVKAIQLGRIEFKEENDTLNVYQHLKHSIQGIESPLVYKEPTGYSKIAMKESGKEDQYGKLYHLLGGMCGHGKAPFLKMRGKDLSVAESLGLLFLDI
jgi:hypothetical protein